MINLLDTYAIALSLLVGAVGFGMTFFFNTNFSEWGPQEIGYPAIAMLYVYARNARFQAEDKTIREEEGSRDANGDVVEATPTLGNQIRVPSTSVPGVKVVSGEPLSAPSDGALTVMFFWATWCSSSGRCLPGFLAMSDRYEQEGIRFVAVSRESEADLQDFVESYQRSLRSVTFLADEQGALTKGYQGAHAQKSIPHCYVVKGDGASGDQNSGLGLVQWHGHPTRLEGALEYLLESSCGDDDGDGDDLGDGDGHGGGRGSGEEVAGSAGGAASREAGHSSSSSR